MKLRIGVALIIAGILIGMSAYYYASRLGGGDTAPSFTLPDITGAPHSIDEYRRHVVVVHFWATWCDACRAEMPALDRFARHYRGRGVMVLGLLEDDHDAASYLQAFTRNRPLAFPVLLDEYASVAKSYDSFAVPATFVIDRDGVIVERIDGVADWDGDGIRRRVEELLDDGRQ